MAIFQRLRQNQAGIVDHAFAIISVVVAFGAIGTFLLVRSNAATACAKQTIGPGNSGKCVLDVEQMLNGLVASRELYPSFNYVGHTIPDNSAFTSVTRSQVSYFQTRYAIGIDGIVGGQTWSKLCYELDHLPHGPVAYTKKTVHEAAVVNTALDAQANSQCHS
jgi:peptidoglycan hydrolase-like protein with peptidoglycan-binding domain